MKDPLWNLYQGNIEKYKQHVIKWERAVGNYKNALIFLLRILEYCEIREENSFNRPQDVKPVPQPNFILKGEGRMGIECGMHAYESKLYNISAVNYDWDNTVHWEESDVVGIRSASGKTPKPYRIANEAKNDGVLITCMCSNKKSKLVESCIEQNFEKLNSTYTELSGGMSGNFVPEDTVIVIPGREKALGYEEQSNRLLVPMGNLSELFFYITDSLTIDVYQGLKEKRLKEKKEMSPTSEYKWLEEEIIPNVVNTYSNHFIKTLEEAMKQGDTIKEIYEDIANVKYLFIIGVGHRASGVGRMTQMRTAHAGFNKPYKSVDYVNAENIGTIRKNISSIKNKDDIRAIVVSETLNRDTMDWVNDLCINSGVDFHLFTSRPNPFTKWSKEHVIIPSEHLFENTKFYGEKSFFHPLFLVLGDTINTVLSAILKENMEERHRLD